MRSTLLVHSSPPTDVEQALAGYHRPAPTDDPSCRRSDVVDTRALLELLSRPGEIVIDIACREVPALTAFPASVAPRGKVVGIELSSGMAQQARGRVEACDLARKVACPDRPRIPPARTGLTALASVVRFASAAGCALLAAAVPAHAQTLRDAVEKAWARQPAALAQVYRSAELAARAKAANAWVPAPPSVGLSERSDRLNRNAGAREVEAELSVPLWLPGQQRHELALAGAEQDLQREVLDSAKLKVAGEVREAYWQARTADADRVAALRRLDDALALAADVERRLKAGDLARTDFNQAKGAEHSARGAANEAKARTARALLAFTSLTGLEALPPAGDDDPAASAPPLAEHPALRQLDRAALAADARVKLATDNRRDNPEFTLAYRRERSSSTEAYGGSVTLGIRIPLATEARNEPRVAAANAEYIEARTAYARLKDQLQAELLSSQRELLQARTALVLAQERQRLAAENNQLLGKAFSLGEIDLATRLRTAAEGYAADADATRSRLEAARAVSRLNQALGVLP